MSEVAKLYPVFAVRNLDVAIEFYIGKLGLSLAWTWGTLATRAGVTVFGVEIPLESTGVGAPSGPSVVYCHMGDVEAYYVACKARGVEPALELGERPWGMIDFRVDDPDGSRLGFGSRSELPSSVVALVR